MYKCTHRAERPYILRFTIETIDLWQKLMKKNKNKDSYYCTGTAGCRFSILIVAPVEIR